MAGKLITGLVSFVENTPAALISLAAADMFLRNTAWSSNGCFKAKGLDKRCPTGELYPLRNRLPLEIEGGFKFELHLSKTGSH